MIGYFDLRSSSSGEYLFGGLPRFSLKGSLYLAGVFKLLTDIKLCVKIAYLSDILGRWDDRYCRVGGGLVSTSGGVSCSDDACCSVGCSVCSSDPMGSPISDCGASLVPVSGTVDQSKCTQFCSSSLVSP
jgi:hypothetical protein